MKYFITATKVISLFLIIFQSVIIAQSPQITNVQFSQRTDGTFKVDIYYDINNPQGSTMIVSMRASSNNGSTWDVLCHSTSGDIGSWITNGTNKHIVWDFARDYPYTFGNQYRIKVVADGGGSPCPGLPTVTYGGRTYNTVQIATQCWLVQNLDIGDMILGSQTPANNGQIEKYCYNNDVSNCNNYGGFYTWNEAMQYVITQGARGICPSGWHIPTNAELQTLSTAAGGDGNSLKAGGQGSGAGAGTNTTGFSALLAGLRNDDGSFGYLNSYAYFWSSTEYSSPGAGSMGLDATSSTIHLGINYYKGYGFSVRCLKD